MADPDPPRKVFVTGASGFVGAALARRLRTLGSEVVGVDRADGGDPAVVRADASRWCWPRTRRPAADLAEGMRRTEAWLRACGLLPG